MHLQLTEKLKKSRLPHQLSLHVAKLRIINQFYNFSAKKLTFQSKSIWRSISSEEIAEEIDAIGHYRRSDRLMACNYV